ncbi:hypothetical protein P5673_010365 [Acropora cervicornis]|uniref:Uncharacterized protein n=1 Tax=Acropora cervicornis TaxID=6130 RepID=A0AAD9V9A2_ACRCE|nr:hypothetical protein P5673_010365 [Acropora cervicornis]
MHVTFPKFKMGEEVVREIAEPASYGYVEQIKQLLFTMTKQDRETITEKYKAKIPEPLTNQFPAWASKDTANIPCFMTEHEQLELQHQGQKRSTSATGPSSKRRKTAEKNCSKCNQRIMGRQKHRCSNSSS